MTGVDLFFPYLHWNHCSSDNCAPTGYILAYGVSGKGVSCHGKALDHFPMCARSATVTHGAFVSKCGFSPKFFPTVDRNATRDDILEDVRRAATIVASHDVVVLFFCGPGRTSDTPCIVDGVGQVVSVRKLQAAFAEAVAERELQSITFAVVLDCCQIVHGKQGQCTCSWYRLVDILVRCLVQG